MIIKKNNHTINSIDDWCKYAPPKKKEKHWVKERSAYELANIWVGKNKVMIPNNLMQILQSELIFKNIKLIEGEPEKQIRFDSRKGEPRNADLAVVGEIDGEKVAINIEAKADEPFDKLLPDALIEKLEGKLKNNNSQALERVVDLVKTILPVKSNSSSSIENIRYQLLTAVAGSVAYANLLKSKYAVLVIHEFHTSKTSPERIKINSIDMDNFIDRISNGVYKTITPDKLYGPFAIPGKPLFEIIPDLYIGKIIDII